jgi:hypothetical protein
LKPNNPELRDSSIRAFFAASFTSDYDRSDASKKPLFRRALAKLGPLRADEMYGFEPAIALGGAPVLENIRKVRLGEHLTQLRQLGVPTLPFANLNL